MRAASIAICLLCVVAAKTFALEVKVVERDGTVVQVSASEPNLIEAAGGRITSFVFSEGMFTQTIDTEAGVVYFRPLQEGPRAGFVEMQDEAGERHRFTLVLVPQDQIEARRIVLDALQPTSGEIPADFVLASQSHVAKIKELLRLMLAAPERGATTIASEPKVVGGVSLLKLRVWHSSGMVGERYRLVNNTEDDYQVVEANMRFEEPVLAVAAAASVVPAGEATDVFVVMRAGEPRAQR